MTMSKMKKKSRFGSSNEEKCAEIIQQRSKPNTQKATKLWINCFTDYLAEKELPKIETLNRENLPKILEHFYAEVRKKEIHAHPDNAPENDGETGALYKNTTLKAIRGALARYFKDKLCIDIMSNEAFICSNQIFEGVTKINKSLGKGNI